MLGVPNSERVVTLKESTKMTDHATVLCRRPGTPAAEYVQFDSTADVPAARRWRAVMRRIDRVAIEACEAGWSCTLHGVGHRLPVRRPISLAVALGLAHDGVPTTLDDAVTSW